MLSRLDRASDRGRDIGPVRGELFEETTGSEGEDTPIPVVSAFIQKRLRARPVRLLHEAIDAETQFRATIGNACAAPDISETSFGAIRLDPEGHQPAFPRQHRAALRRCDECVRVGDVMIAGTNQHHAVARQAMRRQRDRRSGVPRARLEDDGGLVLALLAFDEIEMGVPRNDHGHGEDRAALRARKRLLEQRRLPHQRQKRLGLCSPAARPQPRTAAAAQDYRRNTISHARLLIRLERPRQSRRHILADPAAGGKS